MNLRERILEAVTATMLRENDKIKADPSRPTAYQAADITAAVMGQLADVIGEATQGFQNPRLMGRRTDLRQHPVLGSHMYRVAALRAQVMGDEPVPPRRFYVCHTEKTNPETDAPVLSVTFVRFEQEDIPKSHAGLVAWDLLDPQWPEVQKVLAVMQAALGKGD